MRLLVGLGNPGRDYANNRHNIGFMALDEIARRYGFGPWRRRFQGQLAEGRIAGERVLALKPETYMNESGRAVGEAARFFKLEPAEIVVIYDEIDLVPGKVRVKQGGGAGGHNGIRSIDAHLGRLSGPGGGGGGPDYWRVRLGVGHPGDKGRVKGHVLKDFAKSDAAWVETLLDAVARELPRLIEGDDGGFMSRVAFLTQPPKPPNPPKSPKPPKPPKQEGGQEPGPSDAPPAAGAGEPNDGL